MNNGKITHYYKKGLQGRRRDIYPPPFSWLQEPLLCFARHLCRFFSTARAHYPHSLLLSAYSPSFVSFLLYHPHISGCFSPHCVPFQVPFFHLDSLTEMSIISFLSARAWITIFIISVSWTQLQRSYPLLGVPSSLPFTAQAFLDISILFLCKLQFPFNLALRPFTSVH